VVQPQGTAAVVPVTVMKQDDAQAVIARGLEAGQQVVTTGFAQLADGKPVRVSDGTAPPAFAPPPRRPPGAAGPGRPEAFRRGDGQGRPPGAGRGERRQSTEARPSPLP
jgi:multidrug efflux system membrane fusion protein